MKSCSLALALLLLAAPAWGARAVKFCDICQGYMLTRQGNDVIIRCPNVVEPWMILKGCRVARISGRTANTVTIDCEWAK